VRCYTEEVLQRERKVWHKGEMWHREEDVFAQEIWHKGEVWHREEEALHREVWNKGEVWHRGRGEA